MVRNHHTHTCLPKLAHAQDALANIWMRDMPQVALDVVRNQRLAPGGDLVKLNMEYGRPSSKEIKPINPFSYLLVTV